VILIQLVSAIGISPAKKVFDLDLENDYSVGKIRVINNEQKEMRVVIKVQGNYADYLQFTTKDFIMQASEREQTIEYSLNISSVPPKKLRSGKMSIYVVEIPIAVSLSGSSASASTAAIQKLIINIPEEISAEEEISEVQQASAADTSSGSGSSAQAGPEYVALEDPDVSLEEAELKKPETKRTKYTIVYIVIILMALNLIWIVYMLRKKT
jgi:hypothetical protein